MLAPHQVECSSEAEAAVLQLLIEAKARRQPDLALTLLAGLLQQQQSHSNSSAPPPPFAFNLVWVTHQ